jgi:hypothetical protein
MKPTAGSDHEALAAANREAIRQIHPYQEPPRVPDPDVEEMATEELAGHSPDGRPADKPSWSKGRLALAAALLLFMPGVMFAVWWFGGIDALLMGLVYVVTLILVAFPVWYAGLMRHEEHRDASDIVRHTLSSERFGPTTKAR